MSNRPQALGGNGPRLGDDRAVVDRGTAGIHFGESPPANQKPRVGQVGQLAEIGRAVAVVQRRGGAGRQAYSHWASVGSVNFRPVFCDSQRQKAIAFSQDTRITGCVGR